MCQYWMLDYCCKHHRTQLHKCLEWQDCKDFQFKTVYVPSAIRCEWCEKTRPEKFQAENGEWLAVGSTDSTLGPPEFAKPGDVHAERLLGPKLKDIVDWLIGLAAATNGGDGGQRMLTLGGDGGQTMLTLGGDGGDGVDRDDAAIHTTSPTKRLN